MEIAKENKGKVYIIDFDDYCDNTVSCLYILEEIKNKYPDFKCTLFTIPSRCNMTTIDRAKSLGDWIALAPHGYFHTKGECLGWTAEETVDKIRLAAAAGIDAPIFKAPAWLLDAEVYEACKQLDYVVASHKDFRIPFSNRLVAGPVKEYVYNAPNLRLKWTRSIHGHVSNVSGNWIKDMWEDGRISFREGAKFIHTWEAAVTEESKYNPLREKANV